MTWPFHRARLRIPWAALCLLLAWMLPNAALLVAAGTHTCACGMKGACFCKLAAPKGAHCDMKGGCSMKSAPRPDAAPLLASLGLRGWLRGAAGLTLPGAEPTGTLIAGALPLPPAPPCLPEIPPPRLLSLV